MVSALRTTPEPGHLVHIRQRRWVVSAVSRSALSDHPLRATEQTPQQLITLASVEDDAPRAGLLAIPEDTLGGEVW